MTTLIAFSVNLSNMALVVTTRLPGATRDCFWTAHFNEGCCVPHNKL